MKIIKRFSVCLLICQLGVSGCVTASYFNGKYFGTSYPATSVVNTYYDAKDVKQQYKVIGHFAAPVPLDKKSQDKLTPQMIEQAKKVGADGLIFSQMSVIKHEGFTDYSLTADAIKFTK